MRVSLGILYGTMPTLYMLCGLPGSGKSVRAKELEAAGAGILLNADSWVCQLYPEDAEAAARDERKFLVAPVAQPCHPQHAGFGLAIFRERCSWQSRRTALQQKCRHDAETKDEFPRLASYADTVCANHPESPRVLNAGSLRRAAAPRRTGCSSSLLIDDSHRRFRR